MQKEEIIVKEKKIYLVLSSKQDKYYEVNLDKINYGIKPCNCLSNKFLCKHLNKVIAFESVKPS